VNFTTQTDRFWTRIIYIFSIILTAVIAFLIWGPRPEGLKGALDVTGLPKIIVMFNGMTAILLVIGFILIKQKNRTAHKNVMLTAFGTSAGFLVTYVLYHWFKSGPQLYTGDFTTVYYVILISHIILAIIILPMALMTLYRGWTDQLAKHRKIAIITLPIWLYVSVTGVVVYYMLYSC
jgi:putative membrane protein